MKRLLIVLVLVALLVFPAMAAPAAPSISNIGANGATFTTGAGGATGFCYFRWGTNPTFPEWATPNVTVSGASSATINGMPYLPVTTYYVTVVDSTGMGPSTTFTSGNTTNVPITSYGSAFDTITAGNFNITEVVTNLPAPLLFSFPGAQSAGLAIMAGLLMGFYFVGLWLRQRKVGVPVLLFFIAVAFFLTPQAGFNWGMPSEIATLAQWACYVAVTGMILSLIKKG
jgi:hypothetical protein